MDMNPYSLFTLIPEPMGALSRFVLAVALGFFAASEAPAQDIRSLRVGIEAAPTIPQQASPSVRSLPRWVKWGLGGAAAGAVLFSIAGQSNPDGDRSVAGDAAIGAAIGFVIAGGAIALYDAVCSSDSSSRRAGLCGR